MSKYLLSTFSAELGISLWRRQKLGMLLNQSLQSTLSIEKDSIKDDIAMMEGANSVEVGSAQKNDDEKESMISMIMMKNISDIANDNTAYDTVTAVIGVRTHLPRIWILRNQIFSLFLFCPRWKSKIGEILERKLSGQLAVISRRRSC